ncbi:GTP-ase activating protein for Arf containing protein [Loa loa]|uniref:GTP-ase activating protein for Arf containing protein n=1 Tax=Loa loa TaxID=7209 RepID=A0A1S0UJE1_LOALO|nr:GTP-ase activating protein for Arf containing protein [Loa loa]EJD74934.1 GTP-ase activating protein for Arf containing protein [Loa loa]
MAASESEGSYGAMLSSFTTSVKADLDSPVTSNFGNRIVEYRAEAQRIVEEAEGYTVDFERLRKAAKEVEDTLVILSRQLLAFGQTAKEIATKWTSRSESQYESDVAVILMKMECHIKWKSYVKFANRGVERSCRDYENKYMKAEADARKHAKHAGYTRSQLGHGELAEQLTRERLMVQYELCKFLMSVDSIEDRRGPQLLRHFMELVRNQNSYYMNRVRVNEDFRQDMTKLEERMMTRNANRCAKRNALWDLKGQLEANDEFARSASGRRSSGRDSMNLGSRLSGINLISASSALLTDNDPLSELATSTAFFPDLDFTQSGYLYKKSNKKLHKQWQKRRCRIEDGHFWLSHSDESIPPTKLSLLVSDCKPSTDDPKTFDLYCRERTYHLQADSETDAKRWMLALKREITRVKTKMLSAETPQGSEGGSSGAVSELYERKMCIAKVRQLPGNSICADCSSKEDVQWLSNIGALVCIACSGVHRELGVHVSRIQSLNLDVISPLEFFVPLSSGNVVINRLFEYDAAKCATWKPIPGCTRFDRQRFIQMKYRDRAFVQKLDDPDVSLTEAFNDCDFENAYRALLSSNLTRKPFLQNGPFHQMVLRGTSLSLPVADLVMQLRIEIPDMETIMMDCIRSGNADMVAILLRYRSLSSTVRGIHLHSLITCSEKAQQKKITEMLRSLQLGDSTQVQNVAVPPILFVSTPDSASLSRSSSSVSPCPHLPPDSIASQNFTSKPVNVLMRNGTTISVPRSSLSMEEIRSNRLSKQTFVANEPAHSSVGEGVVQITISGPSSSETYAHNNTQPSSSMNSDGEKDLLTFELPLCTSTPSSIISSARTVAPSNHYSQTLASVPISSPLPISAAPTQSNAKCYIRSASEYSRTTNYSENNSRSGTVRSLPGHLAPQSSSTKGSDGVVETTLPIAASMSLNPIPLNAQKHAMNIYVVAPGKEEIIDKEKCVAETRDEREGSIRNPHLTDEQETVKATSLALDQVRSNFTSCDEHPRSSLMNPLAANGLQREMPRYISKSKRLTRPAPAPPALFGVKLKPPIPAPRRLPSITRENKQRDCARRCRALYDCKADNSDELSFRQGDIIVITKEKIIGENDTWMEGYLENNPLCRGVFPITFVTFLS